MRITCIGGGTGLFVLLSGLKRYAPQHGLSAVVSMMDSGGSTGRLRVEFGHLPAGDVRQCLVALSDAPEDLLRLMTYRFRNGGGLEGHSLGNLILTAAKDIARGEYEAIELVERILHVKGKVYPVTLTDSHLVAELKDGTVLRGETHIDRRKDTTPIRTVKLDPPAQLFERAEQAISEADLVVIGPGDLYTSIMPNLVVDGMAGALKRAKERGAKIVYIVNTMTKRGETDGFTASDFLSRIEGAIGVPIDTVLVNKGIISAEQKRAYEQESAEPVINDIHSHRKIVATDLVNRTSFARHDPIKLAQAILEAVR